MPNMKELIHWILRVIVMIWFDASPELLNLPLCIIRYIFRLGSCHILVPFDTFHSFSPYSTITRHEYCGENVHGVNSMVCSSERWMSRTTNPRTTNPYARLRSTWASYHKSRRKLARCQHHHHRNQLIVTPAELDDAEKPCKPSAPMEGRFKIAFTPSDRI
jgi:hypothetical protein